MRVESLNIAELTMLKEIYKDPIGKNVYYFHQKYKFLPSVLMDFIKKFEEHKLVFIDNNKLLQLTEKGKGWIVENKGYIYLTPKFKYWKMLPKDKLIKPLEGCYLPNKYKIDQKFFNQLKK